MPQQFTSQPVSEPTLDADTKVKLETSSAQDGDQSAVTTKSSGGRGWIWLLLIFLAAGIGIIWWSTIPEEAPGEANIAINITGSEKLPANGETAVQVQVQNNDQRTVSSLELELIYPTGITYVSSVPDAQSLTGSRFELPELASGQNVTLHIKLKAQANVDDIKQLKARLRYRAAGSAAVFIKDASKEWKVATSGIKLEMEGPQTTGNGTLITYTVRYGNLSKSVLSNVRLSVEVPDTFRVDKTEPKANGGLSAWLIPRLDIGQEGTVRFLGTFNNATLGEDVTFRANLGVLGNGGEYNSQANIQTVTHLEQQPLTVEQSLANANQAVVGAGSRINYIIKYRNTSASTARNLRITLKVDGRGVNWKETRAEEAHVNQGVITWSPATTTQLNVIRPSESGSFPLELRLLDPPVNDSSENLSIRTYLTITSDEYAAPLAGNDLEVKIASRPELVAGLTYVSGAYPPKVGQETIYRVTLSMRNTSNDLSESQVVARLVLGAGSVVPDSYDKKEVAVEGTRARVVWNIGELPAYTGIFTPLKTTTFNLRLVPSAADAGSAVEVLADLAFTATDKYVNKPASAKTANLTTNNAGGASKGRVVK